MEGLDDVTERRRCVVEIRVDGPQVEPHVGHPGGGERRHRRHGQREVADPVIPAIGVAARTWSAAGSRPGG